MLNTAGIMDRQIKQWKRDLERLWSAAALDYRAAAQLAADIARGAEETPLRLAAAQALANLRSALLKTADRSTRDLAHRRFGIVRDVLHALDAPRFGRRGTVLAALSPEQRHRQRLGLPLGRRLSGPEIHQAYKRAAKTAHPDSGGNEHEFHELSLARDALMKER
jgi:hypothetical protein